MEQFISHAISSFRDFGFDAQHQRRRAGGNQPSSLDRVNRQRLREHTRTLLKEEVVRVGGNVATVITDTYLPHERLFEPANRRIAMAPTACRRFAIGSGVLTLLFVATTVEAGQQVVDPDFRATVERPAYRDNGPTVAIDEAHSNFHTAGGQYKPLADLLANDGYHVVASTRTFDRGVIQGIDVLVVANAVVRDNPSSSAFTEEESDAVRDWVRDGGSLLLIADHTPFGSAAEVLARRFGVTMGKGWVFDDVAKPGEITTQLVFSRQNGLLGDHPVLRGRDASEAIHTIRSFSGQSLGVPEGATALMKLSASAREAADTAGLDAEAAAARVTGAAGTRGSRSQSVAGRAQGLAMTFGKGKVVVLGEAALFSAQVVTLKEPDGRQTTFKAGMNVPGNDDRQFALNVMHWLTGRLN